MWWSSSRRWAIPPTSCWIWPGRCRPTLIGANSTCCCPRASGSRWPCCRWPSASSEGMRSALPAASPASSRTTATSTRESSRCGRSASRTSWRAEGSSSSPATRAFPTRRRSPPSAAAGATPPPSPLPPRSTRSTARSAQTWTACTRPIRASCRQRTASARCRTRRLRRWRRPAPGFSTRRRSNSPRRKASRSMRARPPGRSRAPTRRAMGRSFAERRRGCPAP